MNGSYSKTTSLTRKEVLVNNEDMKNKNLLYALVGILVLVLLVGGGFYFLNSRNQSDNEDEISEFEEDYPELSPDEIGLTMEARSDGRAVRFAIGKASDIESIEYDLSYEADLSDAEAAEGGEGGRIQRGVTGEDTVTGDTYESEYLDLGSCSSGRCRYDTGVEEVTLVLKITKKDGNIYQVTDSLTL